MRAAVLLISLLCGFHAVSAETVSIPAGDGKLQLPAYWFEAKASGPRPAIIGLHGCGGPLDEKGELGPIWHRDAAYFNAEKMHYLALDSFTPRGVKSICEIPEVKRTIGPEERREDVFAAIQWLAQRPTVDNRDPGALARRLDGPERP